MSDIKKSLLEEDAKAVTEYTEGASVFDDWEIVGGGTAVAEYKKDDQHVQDDWEIVGGGTGVVEYKEPDSSKAVAEYKEPNSSANKVNSSLTSVKATAVAPYTGKSA
ncbi:hypothetical protein [Wolbachia endosymbiont of Pentidionis agamae]|uniref:hypothetical protein n=1 Tax=Wolbachia endosymbiont of Pentidionis agamae TaxID=3110435 RepID=UPI002FD56F9A